MALSSVARRPLGVVHLWIGLIGGVFICALGLSGAVVTFRPQIAAWLSPPASQSSCAAALDWTQAEREVEASTHAAINRVYAPQDGDPRYHFRVRTSVDAVYTHVIYDACAQRVLGTARLEWLDWIVDFHHNFLAGRTGRQYVGIVGIGLLLSGLGGLALVLLSRPSLPRLFSVSRGPNMNRTMFDLHRAVGSAAVWLLVLQASTGVALCFPQALQGVVGVFGTIASEPRPPRAPRDERAAPATLGAIVAAAQASIPDGSIREIRMPDGNGTVQIRMWRAGDFRSLGNNVVSVDRSTARVAAVDRFEGKPRTSRVIQAVAGLHYAEWGGLPYRTLYGLAGLTTAPLFVTGCSYWWLRRRARTAAVRRPVVHRPAAAPVTSQSVDA